MEDKILYIGKSTMETACKDPRFFDALTMCLIIKANYINSTLYQYSLRKVMALCHCNFAKAKSIVNTAISLGWARIEDNGKGLVQLVACKLYHAKEYKYIFHVAESKAGKRIYLEKCCERIKHFKGTGEKAKIANLICCAHNSCADPNCLKKAQENNTVQTFKDVRSIMLQVILLEHVCKLQKSLNAIKNPTGMGEERLDNTFAEEYQKHGVSYKRLAKLYGGLLLTDYQVANIVKKLRQEGMLKCKIAKYDYYTWTDDGCSLAEEMQRFYKYNPDTGKAENVFCRCRRNPFRDLDTYILYMAYVYQTTAKVVQRPRRTHK